LTQSELSDKAAFVREALDSLATLPLGALNDFLADRRNLPSALHWLQTAIQALVDIGLIIIASKGLPAPRTSGDVLERLEAVGAVPEGTAAHYRPVIGFRNRVGTCTTASIPRSSTGSSPRIELISPSCCDSWSLPRVQRSDLAEDSNDVGKTRIPEADLIFLSTVVIFRGRPGDAQDRSDPLRAVAGDASDASRPI
jgi:uncharacterized protein YutE (UPF0331/DUF86 family)